MTSFRAFSGCAGVGMLALSLILAAMPASGCINSFDAQISMARASRDPAALEALLKVAEKRWRETPTLETTNDLAVVRILTGKRAEAIQLLRDLETRQPGNAKVASNLGTALELEGEDEEALKWIRESVRRDPREHDGSEWVHVRILEAKLALKRDPNWLFDHSVVGWREGRPGLADARDVTRSPTDLVAPVTYQLRERTRFIAPPDAVVGDLFLTLGDIAHSYSSAFPDASTRDQVERDSYQQALLYGTLHDERARVRMDNAARRVAATRQKLEATTDGALRVLTESGRRKQQQQQEESAREARRAEQLRRRQLALWVFLSLAAVLSAALYWRRRPRSS